MTIKRGYYYCPACHNGYYPYDASLGIIATRLTPAATEVICIAGVESSFAQAAEVTLVKLAGMNVSESTVERTTEAEGEKLGQQLANKKTFGKKQTWDWSHDALGHTVAYVSVDATGIRQQGEHGAKSDGKMATVAMIYNARDAAETKQRKPERIARKRRYLAGFYTLEELGALLRRQAAQVGWDQAEQQIAISDGGSGLENFFKKNFPLATRILDFFHAKEYLVELGQALFGEHSDACQSWVEEMCQQLKQQGGQVVLQQLEALIATTHKETNQDKLRSTITYFRNHQDKMKYPEYIANGWQIGSGQIESACKTVVNKRLNGSGMRWGSAQSDAVCHLRALYRSEPSQWENYWHPQTP